MITIRDRIKICVTLLLRSNNCDLEVNSQFAIIRRSHSKPILRYYPVMELRTQKGGGGLIKGGVTSEYVRYTVEEVGHAHVSAFCIYSAYYPVTKVHDFQLCIIAKWITYCC